MNRNLLSQLSLCAITYGLFLALSIGQAFACDTDAECGPSGTCFKREKRARGVCYGGDLGGAPKATPLAGSISDSSSAPYQAPADSADNLDSDAPVYGEEGYIEPNVKPRIIDRLDIQDTAGKACVASTDCSGGLECIYRDPMLGHGLCETPP